MTSAQAKSKFAGALLGTFVGDALGMPVEGWSAERIAFMLGSLDEMKSAAPWLRFYSALYGLLTDPKNVLGPVRLGRGTYTDDTQMMIGVAESLAACGGFDGADMARRFVENFDPRRGYGPGAKKAIYGLREGIAWDRVGDLLFGGSGSYGNGGAMRVAPIGIFYHDDPNELRRVAELSASITHTHPLGKEGASLQAFAVACAFRHDGTHGFSPAEFLNGLRAFARTDPDAFPRRLTTVDELLHAQPTVAEVADALGNDITAQGSVATALYAFLSHSHSFKEAVAYAVSLGGDTDTIGAMTGAIAGAFHGVEAIPSDWLEALEAGPKGRDYVGQLAEALYNKRFSLA
ncbi:MAG TPA: ADP-ribosylglycohydrolase family protein [Verrucomicrobiae bacterium]|nr:ADP-ribosylglycohydrolase family protein [Verrucomicrobiae bacterium]